MSVNVSTAFVQQFATAVNLLSQQKGSKLRNAVTVGSHIGKQASPVEQIGSVEMQPVTSQYEPVERVDAAFDRRWVFPQDYDLAQLIDNFDKLRLLVDPSSSYVQNAAFAAGRAIDNCILDAFDGTNKTGTSAGTSTTFPSGYKVSSSFGGTNTGLTVAKLKEARRILMANNVDLESEEAYVVVKAQQHDNLMAEMQVISSDFNQGSPVLKEGRIMRFLGFNFIHSELVNASSATVDLVPCFVKSGVYLGIWGDIQTAVNQRVDLKSMPWQAYTSLTIGATRLEEKKCVQISCYHA